MSKSKNTLLGLNLLALVIVGILFTASVVGAFHGKKGDWADSEKFKEKFAEKHAMMEEMQKEINHEISLIDNGVVITITTDNPELLEQIQTHAGNKPFGEMKSHFGEFYHGGHGMKKMGQHPFALSDETGEEQ